MKNSLSNQALIVILSVILALWLSSPRIVQSEERGPEALFLVRDETGEVIQHAVVYAVTADGTKMVTDTDDPRRARIPLEVQSKGGGAILVCAEGYYCGGWMAGDPALVLVDGESFLYLPITLSAVRLH